MRVLVWCVLSTVALCGLLACGATLCNVPLVGPPASAVIGQPCPTPMVTPAS